MLKAKIIFYTMLSNLVSAGVPLERALTKGMPPKLKRTCRAMSERIHQGESLSSAMKHYSAIFTDLELSLVTVGEATGTLERTADFLRDDFFRRKALRSQITSAMLYPAFTYVVAIPLLTIAELALSQAQSGGLKFQGWGTVILLRCAWAWGIPIMAYILGKRFLPSLLHSSPVGALIDAIPFFGGLQHKLNSAVFWNTLSTCLRSGLTYTQAIPLAANACTSHFYRNHFLKIKELLEHGELTFSEAFNHISSRRDDNAHFTSLVATGETTGHLDDTAENMAEMARESVQQSLKRFSAIFPTAVYLVLVGYLAFKIIGFYANYINKLLSL